MPATPQHPRTTSAHAVRLQFCRLFCPVSVSPGSFSVTPSPPRSIPNPPFEKMLLRLILLLVPPSRSTPAPPLSAIVLALTSFPLVPESISTAAFSFGTEDVPSALVPMQFPSTSVPEAPSHSRTPGPPASGPAYDPLPDIRLPEPAAVPPMTVLVAPPTAMPAYPLPNGSVPVASVPT